jgi:hypothetical protein
MAIRSVSRHSLSMLLWIAIVGGLTLMMGQRARSESLFYYFRLEDQVPENHLLRWWISISTSVSYASD